MNLVHLYNYGVEMLKLCTDYHKNIRDLKVFPNIKPGFLEDKIPHEAPPKGECLDKIFKDVKNIIIPGLVNWSSPYMHGYFPAIPSVPSILGGILENALNTNCFSWTSNPIGSELEMRVMDWLAKMLDLGPQFMHCNGIGGGSLNETTSECSLIAMLAARRRAIINYRHQRNGAVNMTDSQINSLLIGYCSEQAHSSLTKNAHITLINLRLLPVNNEGSMEGSTIFKAIENDVNAGLIPFFACVTLGTTSICSFDKLDEITVICRSCKIWLHVDAAYAGCGFILPELRDRWFKSRNEIDSLTVNVSKWLLVGVGTSALWINDSSTLHSTFKVNPIYLENKYSKYAVDFMDWQIPLSKRFRAIKVWFTLRYFGIEGLQRLIQTQIHLAHYLASLINGDDRFEMPFPQHLGLVVFRLKGSNRLTEILLQIMNAGRTIHCVPCQVKNIYAIRMSNSIDYYILCHPFYSSDSHVFIPFLNFLNAKTSYFNTDVENEAKNFVALTLTVTQFITTKQDIEKSWNTVQRAATCLNQQFVELEDKFELIKNSPTLDAIIIGRSLQLSHLADQEESKLINGSFAATYCTPEDLHQIFLILKNSE